MARRREELIERIATKGEDGRTVIVEVWQEFTESVAMGRDPEWLSGLLAYRLANGLVVTRLDYGTFKVGPTDELLIPL